MSLQPTVENILVQLDYHDNEVYRKQLNEVIDNTSNFFDFAKHLISLKDELKRYNALVALSNTKPYIKLKSNSIDPLEIKEFEEHIKHWADKYKVEIQKVENKNTYYILGKNS